VSWQIVEITDNWYLNDLKQFTRRTKQSEAHRSIVVSSSHRARVVGNMRLRRLCCWSCNV